MIILLTINFILFLLLILLGVAFLTLFERKILSYIHNRKGPNKVNFKGFIQPISDAMKLLSKEMIYFWVNKFMFVFSPMMMFILSMMLWLIYPWLINTMNLSLIYVVFILGLGIYPVMMLGWCSNNNYAMLGSMRSVSQMISFEISLFLMIFIIMLLIESYSFIDLYEYQIYIKFGYMMFPLYFMFFVSMLIELNRTPFDLIEGESELVSGFNVEYYSSLFMLIFLAEYSGILFMSMFLSIMFFGMNIDYSLSFWFYYMFHMILIVWIRGVLPRIRYDELMYMCWTDFLILVLYYLFNVYLIKEFFMMIVS